MAGVSGVSAVGVTIVSGSCLAQLPVWCLPGVYYGGVPGTYGGEVPWVSGCVM